MSHISSAFLFRFLDDVWDLLPTEDRELFQSYWKGQVRIGADLEQKTLEAAQSTEVSEVPVFLTERWNRFVMDEDSTDQFEQTDELLLVMTAAQTISRETAFYDTLSVSNASRQIPHEETIRFFDDSVRELRYPLLVPGTISIRLVGVGGIEYTPGRDYVVNEFEGTVQALDSGRIPPTEILTVYYQHEEYTEGLDYTVDHSKNTIARTASSAIPSGSTVYATYTYNGTATLPLQSESGAVDVAVLTDYTKNFSTLLPGRTLTISEGANEGTYTINSILNDNQIQIAELFPQTQDNNVVYSIDAFPHGVKVSSQIESIPLLQNLVDSPDWALVEGVDYVVSGGILSMRAAFPLSKIGPEDTRQRQAWAEITKVNKQTPYRNFGVLIDFFRENSEAYKLALQGLWFTFWTGSTPGNLGRGLHILLGLPFARRAGTVTRVDTDLAEIDITEDSGRIITYTIPSGLDPVVARGDAVPRFESLTTGVQIIDRNNEPGFVASRLGRAGIEKFLTSQASKGDGDTDETKALTLLENHLFLPQVLTEAITQRVNVAELVTFLDNMKPQWTEYVFSFAAEIEETLYLSADPHDGTRWVNLSPGEVMDAQQDLNLTTTISNNEFNKSFILEEFIVDSISGEVLAAGSQATGNFRDLTKDFVVLGVDAGSIVFIPVGNFKGYHLVLERQSTNLLSLDIPDSSLIADVGIEYKVLSKEQSILDHDSIQLRGEHTVLPGTDYLSPSTLNTKTDIDLVGIGVTNEQAKTLLLVDIGNVGNEVQAITDADVETGEFDVSSSPGVVTRDHEIASAALKRTNNVATVTDAFAI